MTLNDLKKQLNAMSEDDLNRPTLYTDVMQERFSPVVSLQRTNLGNPLVQDQYVIIISVGE